MNVYYYENQLNSYSYPQQIQTSVPINTNAITLPVTLANGMLNPNNPFAAIGQPALINYAFGDEPFSSTYDDHVIRGTAGVKGKLFGFSYETDVTIAHNSLDTVNRGYINYDQLIGDINSGAYSFVNPLSNSAATLAALSPALTKTSTSDLDTFDIHATRDLFQLPGGPLGAGGGRAAPLRGDQRSGSELHQRRWHADQQHGAGARLGEHVGAPLRRSLLLRS